MCFDCSLSLRPLRLQRPGRGCCALLHLLGNGMESAARQSDVDRAAPFWGEPSELRGRCRPPVFRPKSASWSLAGPAEPEVDLDIPGQRDKRSCADEAARLNEHREATPLEVDEGVTPR